MRGLDFLWEIFCLQFSVQGYNDNDDGIYILWWSGYVNNDNDDDDGDDDKGEDEGDLSDYDLDYLWMA